MTILKNLSPVFIITHTKDVLKRFPLVVLATTATAVLWEIAYSTKQSDKFAFAIMALILTIPLLVGAVITREAQKNSWAWDIIALILAGGYFLFTEDKVYPSEMFRYAQLLVGAHLLVAFIPFVTLRNENSFWVFNKTLFLRFLLSSLYSAILAIGVFIILPTIGHLFGLGIPDACYRYCLLFCAFIFQPIHFLKGVPRGQKPDEEYPRGLMVICKYLLVPLISIYGLILLAYELNILIKMSWPKGTVSSLVLVYSIAGIFTLLMLNPLRVSHDSWVTKYSRLFYISEILLGALMLTSVSKRINEYGVTESRYLVFAAAVWILAIAFYQIFSKRKNILWIPITLCLTSVLTAYGPWGLKAVSLRSQKGKLENLLVKNGILKNGKVTSEHGPLPKDDLMKISSAATYLENTHGDLVLRPWVTDGVTRPVPFFKEAGIEPQLHGDPKVQYFRNEFVDTKQRPFDVTGHRSMIQISYDRNAQRTMNASFVEVDHKRIRLFKDKKVIIDWPYSELFKRAGKKPEYSEEPLVVKLKEEDGLVGMIYVDTIEGEVVIKNGEVELTKIRGILFLK